MSDMPDNPPVTAEPAATGTLLIIAVNLLVFTVMALTGAGVFSPNGESLVQWGANYGPLTLHGQWWRMGTSQFVHVGLVHLVMNMVVLLSIGAAIEAAAGTPSFLALYLAAGFGGSAASLAWSPFRVSAGASGAIFGLYGALLALLLLRRRDMPSEVVQQQWKGAVFFVGYNLVYGLARPEIDMAAHVGGLLTGFAIAALAYGRGIAPSPGATARRIAAAAAASVAIVAGSAALLPPPDDVQPDIRRFAEVEHKTLTALNASIDQWKSDRVESDEVLRVIEQEVVPKWRTQRDTFAQPRRLSPRQQEITASLVKYIDARQASWSLLARGIRRNDVATIRQANEKMTEADRLAQSLGEPAKKP